MANDGSLLPAHRIFLTLVAVLTVVGCSGDPGASGGAGDGLAARTEAPRGAAVRIISIVQHDRRNRFDPVEVTVSPGDAVRFVLTGGRPESVVFDDAAVTPEVAAFIREHSMNLGVLMIEPGQSHEVSFEGAPPGRYPFRSIPHAEEGMAGVVIVAGAEEPGR
jgi:plastocyanin